MKKINNGVKRHPFTWNCSFCTKKAFEEYNLDNGLHILQNDPSAPVVITSVMYQWCQNENPKNWFRPFFRTSFICTENIKRGEWFKIVTGNGGTNNANTTEDRTYYYEVFI
jgi:hypothetical protein